VYFPFAVSVVADGALCILRQMIDVGPTQAMLRANPLGTDADR
jgi:hypothetical protein